MLLPHTPMPLVLEPTTPGPPPPSTCSFPTVGLLVPIPTLPTFANEMIGLVVGVPRLRRLLVLSHHTYALAAPSCSNHSAELPVAPEWLTRIKGSPVPFTSNCAPGLPVPTPT